MDKTNKQELTSQKMTLDTLKNAAARKLIDGYTHSPSKLDSTTLYDDIKADIQRIQSENDIELVKPISEYMDEALKPIYTYKLPIDSPFKRLGEGEAMLLRNGLITIGAEANTGKTSLATHLAIELMQANTDTCFIFFSLDDSRVLGIKRILSQIGKKSYMRTGHENIAVSKKDKDTISKLLPHIYIVEKGKTPTDIKRTIKAVQSKEYTNVIVCIDYIQLLNGNTDPQVYTDKRNILNSNLTELKQIQIETNSFFMILSQLNRNTNTNGYRYRETSEIENVSDICIDLEHTSKEDIASHERTIRISKNKLGVKGMTYNTSIKECFMFGTLETKPAGELTTHTKENKTTNEGEYRTWN